MQSRFCRFAGLIASVAPRLYSPGFARRPPVNPAVSALAEKLLWLFPRFANGAFDFYHGTGLRSEKFQELDRTTEGQVEPEKRKFNDEESMTTERIWHASIVNDSSHRDGAIYKRQWGDYLVHMDDRNETVSELEKRSKGPCLPHEEYCVRHLPCPMIQIFSLRLAKAPVSSGSIQLYGYMATRDDMDGLLNYVFNRSRDNPLIVEQGSHMEMTGPKRGILVLSDVLMEFDMRIKTGEKEEHDLQLIDGVVVFSQRISTRPFTLRYNGTNGAVDMGLTLVDAGMETTIEVIVSEVERAFHLSLSSFVSFTEELKEFQLFHGTIGELVTKRYVVAVPMETVMHLKFKVGEKGSGDAAHYCSFNSKHHGCVHREIKLDMATILVKVTVSAPL
ncbi:unnamed protein product [Urochloa decumbens]|uniref:DUF6598 domain-containing protein n=2 Tax=Urochloa decumbens TaxID=240449 RepID=A0ABC9EXM2_9POAL